MLILYKLSQSYKRLTWDKTKMAYILKRVHKHTTRLIMLFVVLINSRYDYLFDTDEADERKVPCLCQTANCRKFMN